MEIRTWLAAALFWMHCASMALAGVPAPIPLEPLPQGRVFPAAAGTSEHLYVLGGAGVEGVETADLWRYDATGDAWTVLTPAPVPMQMHGLVAVDGKLYVPGHATEATTHVYDIATDRWSTIAANGGYSARSQYMALLHAGRILVLGGIRSDTSTATDEVWSLDPSTGIWQTLPPMSTARIAAAAGSIGSELVVTGGVGYPGFVPVMSTEVFDGIQWAAGPMVPSGGGAYTRWSYMGHASSGDSLWLFGGRRDSSWAVLDHIGRLQRTAGGWEWSESPALPVLLQPRVYLAAANRGERGIHVIGGRDSAGSTVYAAHEFVALEFLFADGFETAPPL